MGISVKYLLVICGLILSSMPIGSLEARGKHRPEPKWHVKLGDAPGFPQDVHMRARGNNEDGWKTKGYIEVGPLAQCCVEGDYVLVEMTVVEGGIYGVDGTPVEPGTYEFTSDPDKDGVPDTLTQELGGEDRYFYVIFDGLVVESNEPANYPLPVGATFTAMFTFPFEGQGRHFVEMGTMIETDDGFIPILNEGLMKYRIEKVR